MDARSLTILSNRLGAPSTTRPFRVVAFLATTLWLGVVTTADAATLVYHSPADNGVPSAGAASITQGGVRSIYLYVDGGATASAPSSACNDGAGDEVCGYELLLAGQGGLTIVGFNPDGAADLVVNAGASDIVINGLDTVGTTPGPKRIGELLVNAAPGGSIKLTSGEVVGADLGSEMVFPWTLATVPEPGLPASIGAGLLLLEALRRRRIGR